MMLRENPSPQGIDISQQMGPMERFRLQLVAAGCPRLLAKRLACCSQLVRHHLRGPKQTRQMIFVLR
jgi:hypothetical protein